MSGATMRRVVQEARHVGLALDKSALKALIHLRQTSDDNMLQMVLAGIDRGASDGAVTAAQVKEALECIQGADQEDDFIQVISAFEVPKVEYDPVRKCFFKPATEARLLGDAEDKMAVYIGRYYLIHQRLRRKRGWYRPSTIDAAFKEDVIELTELKAMLGMVGHPRIVIGCITQTEDGRFSIEDLSASLRLDLSEAVVAAGFITENSIVVAEGQLQHNGTFKVMAMGQPPIESREASLLSAKGLDFFGGREMKADDVIRALQWEIDNQEARVVVISDLWLDQPQTLDRLQAVLAGYEAQEHPPPLFVLMGNFCVPNLGSSAAAPAVLRENFNTLAASLRAFPHIRANSRFVFVPGPLDPGGGGILPQPPLPAYFSERLAEELPSAVFASNPCRIRYGNKEMVFFRSDMARCMRRLCLLPPQDCNTAERMFITLAQTLLQQSHLSPVPLGFQPIYWQYDQSLSLYPVPHLLVLADSTPSDTTAFEGCHVLNPGSFADKTFAAYIPADELVELCDVPDEE